MDIRQEARGAENGLRSTLDAAALDRLGVAAAMRPRLLAVARRHADSPADAEDAVSTATLRVVDAPVTDAKAVEAWLVTTTVRACSELRRRARVTPRVAVRLTTAVDQDDPADRVCDRAEARWFATRIRNLPTKLRRTAEVLGRGGTYRDVARELGVTERAAREYVQEARARLRRIVASTRGSVVALLRRATPPVPRRAVGSQLLPWEFLTVLVGAGLAGTIALVVPRLTTTPVEDVGSVRPTTVDDGVERAHELRAASSVEIAQRRLLLAVRRTQRHDNGADGDISDGLKARTYGSYATRQLPPELRRPLDERAPTPEYYNPGENDDRRDSPPLHEWVVWCVTNVEVSPRNVGCPDEGAPGSG